MLNRTFSFLISKIYIQTTFLCRELQYTEQVSDRGHYNVIFFLISGISNNLFECGSNNSNIHKNLY